ncbi:hypothetical protein GGF31_004252 [Allomyces arbusculus]|nr:hypothetical protein GGF31_004252 [Allomyces arbusculus]
MKSTLFEPADHHVLMTTLQDQSQVPNGTCHRTITDVALRVSTLAELKELIENDASVRAFIKKVLADFEQAHGQQREETVEAVNAEDDQEKVEEEEEDPTLTAEQFRTKNGEGKALTATEVPVDASIGSEALGHRKAAAVTEVVDATPAPTPAVVDLSMYFKVRKPAAATKVVDAAPAPTPAVVDGSMYFKVRKSAVATKVVDAAPTSTAGNVFQQRAAAARASSLSSSSSSGTVGRASTTVPSGLNRPHDTMPKAECQDLLQYIGPASVHKGYDDGAHLPSRIPREITSFIEDVRTYLGSLRTFDSLYYVEYHGGTWFFAAGLLAYLHRNKHRTNYNWNYDDYVIVRKEIQGKLLAAMKARRLRGIEVGDDMLAPGNDAGKGGNNGWPWTWFVRLDVYKARFA